jgi:retron-type reverse transcriptase
LKAELDKLKKGDNSYSGLIKILANSEYLKASYLEIKSKPGNMSKGMDDTTLDGISNDWFTKTAEDIKTGKYNFAPSRRVLIPKPGKKEFRPLNVGNPRDKIIQKALTMLLEAI